MFLDLFQRDVRDDKRKERDDKSKRDDKRNTGISGTCSAIGTIGTTGTTFPASAWKTDIQFQKQPPHP